MTNKINILRLIVFYSTTNYHTEYPHRKSIFRKKQKKRPIKAQTKNLRSDSYCAYSAI